MRAQLELRRERLAGGDDPLGWKVGFGSPPALERLGTDAPLVGFLTRSAVVDSGSAVAVGDWAAPVAEPEIAVHLGRDLPPGSDAAAAGSAIGALGPAIELADVNREPDDPEAILAGNIFQRGVVLGLASAERAGGSVEGLTGIVTVGPREVARTDDLEAMTGRLVDLVRHVADLLGSFGESLRAGEVVIAGSFVPPLAVSPGTELRVELAPLGAVEVSFVA